MLIIIGSQTLEQYERQAKMLKRLNPDISLIEIKDEIAEAAGFRCWLDFRKKFSTGRENIPNLKKEE